MPSSKNTLRTAGGAGLCICGPCPSYTECMRAEGELLFCRTGRSDDCMFDRQGCSCPSCPSRPEGAGAYLYYCAHAPRGSR